MIAIFHKLASYWSNWSKRSVNKKIFSAMVTVGGVTSFEKVVTAAQHLVIAYYFGTSDALDAFLIAYVLPLFTISVIAGSFNSAFMPTYIQVRENQGQDSAKKLFSSLMVCSIGFTFIICALLAISGSFILPLIGSGFNAEKIMMARSLFFILLPILILKSLSNIWSTLLNADERFALAASAPILTPVVTIIIIVATTKIWGVFAIAYGTLAGFLFEASLLACAMKQKNFSIIPRWYGFNEDIKQVIKQYAPMVAGMMLMSSAALVDKAMAASLTSGSVAALNYGNKIVAGVIGIGATALSVAIFPHFSRMIAVKDWKSVHHTLKMYIRLIVKVTIPLTFLFYYFSEDIVKLLFERGSFSASDTHLVGRVQAFYTLQIPFYLLAIIGVRLLSALRKNKLMMIITAANLIINIAGNYFFMYYLGVSGISLSTSVVYFISTIFIYLLLNQQLNKELSNEQ